MLVNLKQGGVIKRLPCAQRLYTFSGLASLGGLITGAVPSLVMVTPAGSVGITSSEDSLA
jgi:hypothetical protein